MTDFMIKRAIRKAVKEGTVQEQLEGLLVDVIGIYRNEAVVDKDTQDELLRNCLENALKQT